MKRQERYRVDFPVYLAWHDPKGVSQRVAGRCLDLSASGAQVETIDPFTAHTMLLVSSESFGRMGNATVRYCRRVKMKYMVGLQFTVLLQLSDPVRRRILEKVTPGLAAGDPPAG